MTAEKAIEILQKSNQGNKSMLLSPTTFFCAKDLEDGIKNTQKRIEALELAIHALRARQEAEKTGTLKTTWETPETCPHCMEHLSREWSFCPECGRPTDWSENAPLTLAELREMDGEPVWIVSLDGRNEPCWMLVDVRYELCREAHGGLAVFETYGKTWLAYRRRPEGDDTNA